MEAKLVRVSVHGKRERLPTRVAAERMVERYGEAVYSQEVLARRSAFFAFWREVDEALAAKLGEAELRRRVCAIVEQGRVPAIDLLDILSAYEGLEGR